ncbi:MAG: glycosyltransferase, partial [Planctomycetota bacterium]
MNGGAERRVRVLLAGPLPIDGDVVGGTKVSFARLARGLRDDERLDVRVFDTSRARAGRGRMRRLVGEVATLARLLGRAAFGREEVVVLNASSGGLLSSGPLVWAACRLRGARFVVRVFGGDLDLFLDRAPWLRRALFRRTTARADLLLLQTRALCERLDGARAVRWLPTTREPAPRDAATLERDGVATRFLFVGQLRAEKGVADAVAAANALGAGVTLTVAGPAMPGFDVDALESTPRWSWVGPLPPAEVARAMADHDVLVFPSRHAGEGLPGTIVEAMQLGLPVVAARWRSVP